MAITIHDFKENEPMKYWSLPGTASDNQKAKLQKAVRGSDYYATLKRDGAWYKFVHDGEDSVLQSRTISRKTGDYVEKQDNVPHVIEELKMVLPDKTVVLGEIFLQKKGTISSDIVSIMGCLPAKALARQKEIKLHYYIFDVLMYDGIDVHEYSAEKRMGLVEKIRDDANAKGLKYIEFAEAVYENLEDQIGAWLEAGEEGAVLMHKKKPYKFGRSPAWATIKFKQSLTEDLDLVVMGFTDPVRDYTGKYPITWQYWENLKTGELVEGNFYTNGGYQPVAEYYFRQLIGGFELGAYYGDKLVRVGQVANLTDGLREDATANPDKYIGTVVEVSAMSIDVERQSLRHAKLIKLRPDKDAKECDYSLIF